MDTLTILIADDHPIFRKGLRTLPSMMTEIALVGEATSGEEAIQLAEKLQSDVILIDRFAIAQRWWFGGYSAGAELPSTTRPPVGRRYLP